MSACDLVWVQCRLIMRNWFNVGIWRLVLEVVSLLYRAGGRMTIGSRGVVICSPACLGEGGCTNGGEVHCVFSLEEGI